MIDRCDKNHNDFCDKLWQNEWQEESPPDSSSEDLTDNSDSVSGLNVLNARKIEPVKIKMGDSMSTVELKISDI